DALGIETRNLFLETARGQQYVFRWHVDVIEENRRPLGVRHELRNLADRETRRATAQHHRTDAADAGAIAYVNEILIRVRVWKYFRAVDAKTFPVGSRGGFEIGRRRAGVGLGHADCND